MVATSTLSVLSHQQPGYHLHLLAQTILRHLRSFARSPDSILGFPFHFHSPHPPPLNSRVTANVPYLDCLSSLLTTLPSSISLCDAFYFVHSSQVCFLKYRPNSGGLELKLLVIFKYKFNKIQASRSVLPKHLC